MKSKLQGEIAGLPRKPGVYYFKNSRGEVLYVGKATNLRERVRSYFPVRGRGLWIEKMVADTASVSYKICRSSTEALLLEAAEIQRLRPKFNTRLKDDKSYLYIVVKFPPRKVNFRDVNNSQSCDFGVFTARKAEAESYRKNEETKIFGPFPNSRAVRQILKVVRRLYPYRSCKVLPKRPCLYKNLGLCLAPCLATTDNDRLGIDDLNNYKKLVRFLSGDVDEVIEQLRKKMESASKNKDFEEAALLRDRIAAIEHIGQVVAINDELRVGRQVVNGNSLIPKRIEAYDVSDIGGACAVGAMVVFTNGEPDKKEYRRFKIKTVNRTTDDYEMMIEIIRRRLGHENWPKPDLIVVDGGKGHLSKVCKFLNESGVHIPLIALAKGVTRKGLKVFQAPDVECQLPTILLKTIQAEMHRFAIAYHRRRRRLDWRGQFEKVRKS